MELSRAVLCGVLGIAGCASGHPKGTVVRPLEIPLALQVDNRNWSDVVIYVVHDGSRSRFMDVAATKSAMGVIPKHFVGAGGKIQLLVHRIGAADGSIMSLRPTAIPDDFLTPLVSVRTGRTIALTLESNLELSSLAVW